MKECSTCNTLKPVEDFNWRDKAKGIRNYLCRTCSRKSSLDSYKKNRESRLSHSLALRKTQSARFAEYKSTLSCTKCGEDDSCCLDFHHLKDKDEVIAVLVTQGYSWKRIMQEIDKCVVLCRNCHAKAHKYDWTFT